MTVGENIKRIRKEKGLTQKKLGELCGINEVQIRRYELGGKNANPKLDTIQKIATGLGVSMEDLLAENDTFKVRTMTRVYQNEDGSRYETTEKFIDLTDRALYIDYYDNYLNKRGQKEALKRISELARLEEYTEPPHKLELVEVTDEELADMDYIPPED